MTVETMGRAPSEVSLLSELKMAELTCIRSLPGDRRAADKGVLRNSDGHQKLNVAWASV